MTVLRGFSHFNRLAVLLRLAQGPARYDELVDAMGVCVKSFYHHLHYLRCADLVTTDSIGGERVFVLVQPSHPVAVCLGKVLCGVAAGAVLLGVGAVAVARGRNMSMSDMMELGSSFVAAKTSQHTIADRVGDIEAKKPQFVKVAKSAGGRLRIFVFKQEWILEVHAPGWKTPRRYPLAGCGTSRLSSPPMICARAASRRWSLVRSPGMASFAMKSRANSSRRQDERQAQA